MKYKTLLLAAALLALAGCIKADSSAQDAEESVKKAKQHADELLSELTRYAEEHPEAFDAVKDKFAELTESAADSEWAGEIKKKAKEIFDACVKKLQEDALSDLEGVLKTIKEHVREKIPTSEDLDAAYSAVMEFLARYDREEVKGNPASKAALEKALARKKYVEGLKIARADLDAAVEKAASAKTGAEVKEIFSDYQRMYPSSLWKVEMEKQLADAIERAAEAEAVAAFDGVPWKTLYDGENFFKKWTVEGTGRWEEKDGVIIGHAAAGETALAVAVESTSKDALVEFQVRVVKGTLWVLGRAEKERGAWSFDWIKVSKDSLPSHWCEADYTIQGGKISLNVVKGETGTPLVENNAAGLKRPGLFGLQLIGPAEVYIKDVRIKVLK